MLSTISDAVQTVLGSEVGVFFEERTADLFGAREGRFPYVSISSHSSGVQLVTSTGFFRVGYAVKLSIFFLCSEESGSIEREQALKDQEKNCRAILYNIGVLHSDGGTECEIDEDSISIRSASLTGANILETTMEFNINFDEDYSA